MCYNANIRDVSYYVRVNPTTIRKWYKWYARVQAGEIEKPKGMPPLPEYKVYSGFEYWRYKDIKKIVKFRIWKPVGLYKM